MQTIQDSIDDLNRCTVTIQEAGSSAKVLGTGVVVTNDGLILTCYHVVGDIKNKTIKHGSIDVYFPESKITKSAQIVKEYSDPSIDVAFFKMEDESLPEKTVVSDLGESIIWGHKFASIGFRKPQVFEKLSSSGEIRIKTSFKTKDGNESPSLIQLYSDEIEPGMSGSPVLDLEANKVVGIISQHWVTSGNVDTRLNFAIPVSSIIEKSQSVSPILKENNPGLSRVSWRDRITMALDAIDNASKQHEIERKNEFILDTRSRNSLNHIPIAGSIIIDWYNNAGAPEEEKVKKIYQLLLSLRQLNEEQLISLSSELTLNYNKVIKNKEMVSELILKTKRMIKGEIGINHNSISKSEETLLQESSRKADPAQKEILSTLLYLYLNQELKQIEGFNKSILKDLQFYKSLSHILNITKQVFDNQRHLRDELYRSFKHNYKEEVSKYEEKDVHGHVKIMFEDMFAALYYNMNNTEKETFDFIRNITKSMARYNIEMFTLIDSNRDFFEDKDMPELPYLHEHLRLWIEKYESKKSDPRMCIVYVGVKQKTPFPSTIMETARKKYDSLKELYDRDAKGS